MTTPEGSPRDSEPSRDVSQKQCGSVRDFRLKHHPRLKTASLLA